MTAKRKQPVVPADSIVMLFHGPGWGKTSAAIGYGIRGVGRGWQATLVQFVKGAAWNSAEAHVAERAGMRWPAFTQQLTWAQNPQQLCNEAWDVARSALCHEHGGLVILDEVAYAVANGWLSLEAVVNATLDRCPKTSVIITGQHIPEAIHDIADTVMYFAREKHSERRGILSPEH